jgi:hypothetical protein
LLGIEKVDKKLVRKKWNAFESKSRSFLSNLIWSEGSSEKMTGGVGFFDAEIFTPSILGQRELEKVKYFQDKIAHFSLNSDHRG